MRNKRGASLVEFALIAPLLFILVLGIVEFGCLLYDKAMITNASREGARYGIVMANPRMTEDQIRGVVGLYLLNHLISLKGGTASPFPADAGHVEITGAGGSFPDDLTVTVYYDYGFLVIPKLVTEMVTDGGVIHLSARTIMRME